MGSKFKLESVGIYIAQIESRRAYLCRHLELIVGKTIKADKTIDLRGVSSPWSILKAKSQLIAMEPGEVLEMLANESIMYEDFPKVIGRSEHQLIDTNHKPGFIRLYLRRGNKEESSENKGFQANLTEYPTQRR